MPQHDGTDNLHDEFKQALTTLREEKLKLKQLLAEAKINLEKCRARDRQMRN